MGEGGHALGTRAAGRGGACALGTAPLVTQRVGGGEGRRAGRRAHEPERLAGYGSALRPGPRPCCPEGGSGRGARSDHELRCGVWGRSGTATRCPALSPAPAPGGPGRLGRANRPLREAESRQVRWRKRPRGAGRGGAGGRRAESPAPSILERATGPAPPPLFARTAGCRRLPR